MPRRSSPSLRRLTWPSLLVAIAIVGCRQFQQKTPVPTPKPTPQKRAPRATSRPDFPAPPGVRSSGEGNLLLGNPTRAARDADNFLLDRAPFSLSYNQQNGGPNWVAWHTDASDLGDVERGDNFAPDPDLPPDSQIRPTDYRASGYDRGHVCPSGDRTSNRDANSATFYMSNMLPQSAALNRHVWADLENYVRGQVRQGNEAYQIAGGAGSAGRLKNKINVPKICWKVVLFLPVGNGDLRRINSQTRVLAVGIPNVEDTRLETGDWRSYLTTVSKLESATNLDLLAELPDAIEKALENRVDATR